MTLEQILDRLADLTPFAQQRWEAEQREEFDDPEWEAEHDLYLSLEQAWVCGWRVQQDEATVWAVYEGGGSPLAAAQAMLKVAEGWAHAPQTNDE